MAILLSRSGFGDSFGHVDDSSKNIQDIPSLDSGLVWNYVAVCGGRIALKILVRDSS